MVGEDADSDGVDDPAPGANDGAPSDEPDSTGGSGGADDGAGSDDGAGDGTQGDPADDLECPAEVFELLWVDQATVEPPMHLSEASTAQGKPAMASSEIEGAGTVRFEIEIPCAGDYRVFGLVWDVYPGVRDTEDADSFHVGVGGADEFVWRYGCQTGDEEYAMSWQSLQTLDGDACGSTALTVHFAAAGTYAISVRNIEAGSDPVVAGISALLVTSDLDADAYDAYEPYPS